MSRIRQRRLRRGYLRLSSIPPPFPFLCASLPGSHPRERFLSHALPPPFAAGYAEAGARNKTTKPVVIRTCRGSPPPGGCRPGLPLAAAAANHRQSLTVPDSSFLSAARERPGARCWILKAPALVAMRILCGESRIRVASESGQSRIRVASESGQSRIRVASESCGSREPGRCAAACHAPLNATLASSTPPPPDKLLPRPLFPSPSPSGILLITSTYTPLEEGSVCFLDSCPRYLWRCGHKNLPGP